MRLADGSMYENAENAGAEFFTRHRDVQRESKRNGDVQLGVDCIIVVSNVSRPTTWHRMIPNRENNGMGWTTPLDVVKSVKHCQCFLTTDDERAYVSWYNLSIMMCMVHTLQ